MLIFGGSIIFCPGDWQLYLALGHYLGGGQVFHQGTRITYRVIKGNNKNNN